MDSSLKLKQKWKQIHYIQTSICRTKVLLKTKTNDCEWHSNKWNQKKINKTCCFCISLWVYICICFMCLYIIFISVTLSVVGVSVVCYYIVNLKSSPTLLVSNEIFSFFAKRQVCFTFNLACFQGSL